MTDVIHCLKNHRSVIHMYDTDNPLCGKGLSVFWHVSRKQRMTDVIQLEMKCCHTDVLQQSEMRYNTSNLRRMTSVIRAGKNGTLSYRCHTHF